MLLFLIRDSFVKKEKRLVPSLCLCHKVLCYFRSNAEEERIAATETHQSLLSQGYNHTNVTIPYVDSYRNIYIFTGIIAAVFIFGMVRALLFFKVAVDASQKLHNSMFARILRCPISFFDINPVGQLLLHFFFFLNLKQNDC